MFGDSCNIARIRSNHVLPNDAEGPSVDWLYFLARFLLFSQCYIGSGVSTHRLARPLGHIASPLNTGRVSIRLPQQWVINIWGNPLFAAMPSNGSGPVQYILMLSQGSTFEH